MPTIINDDGGFLHWPEEPEEVIDPKVLGEDWTDVGFVADVEDTIFHAPTVDPDSKWFERIPGPPLTMSVEAKGVGLEALSTLFGFDGSKSGEPRHAVVIDTTDVVSGAPPYPHIGQDLVLELPWWRFLERRRRIAERERLVREWEKAYADWVDDGKPDREVHIRRYIPNARIEVESD